MQVDHSRIAFAFAAGALSLVASIAMPADHVVRGREGAIAYLNGGVGKDERAAMDRVAGHYNLRLTFSERDDSEMVAGVHLRVLDESGHRVFALADAGPVTSLRLPPGRYEVVTTLAGRTERQDVVLAEGEKKVLGFHWKHGG